MYMEKKVLLIIVALFITISGFGHKHVRFHGSWDRLSKSITKDLPIHAWIEDNNEEISLFFDNNLGTVFITITDSFGNVLCNQTVDTSKMPSFIIPMNNIKGECILSITDGKNQIYSQFSIN